MRVLLWHVHGSWTTSFVQGPHTYLVPVTADRGPDGLGRARTCDWPASVVEVTPAQLRQEDVDVVVLQRPHEAGLVEGWLGRRARTRRAGGLRRAQHAQGRRDPRGAASGRRPRRRHSRPRHPLQPAVLGQRARTDHRHRARRRRPGRALHRRASPGRSRHQRAGPPVARHRYRPVARVRRRRAGRRFRHADCGLAETLGSGRTGSRCRRPAAGGDCTTRWRRAGSTSTPSGGPRSACRCSRRCTSACRWWCLPRTEAVEAVPAGRRRDLDAA